MGPVYCLEVEILPNLPSSVGYKHIITMMDVFSRYLFAYLTKDMTGRTVGRCIIDVMTRQYYLHTVILTDKGSQFQSEVQSDRTNACYTDTLRNNQICKNN